MSELYSEEKKKILHLIHFDQSKTLNEQSVVGAPSAGTTSTYTQDGQAPKTYQEQVDEWQASYKQVLIPWPSTLYGDTNLLIIPKTAAPVDMLRSEFNELNLQNQGKKIGSYKQSFNIPPTLCYYFIFEGQKYFPFFEIQGDTLTVFKGYGVTEGSNKKWYLVEDHVKPFPTSPSEMLQKTSQVLTIIEVGTFIIGIVLAPFTAGGSLTLMGISAAAGIANAAVNYADGKYFTGTMFLFFSFIGGYPVYKQIFQKLFKYSSKEVLEAIAKYEAGGQLSKRESQIVKEVIEEFTQHNKEVMKVLAMGTARTMLTEILAKYGINTFLKQAAIMGVLTVPIMGLEYGIGEIFIAMNYDKDEIEENSASRKLWHLIWGDNKEPGEQPTQDIIKEIDEQIIKSAEQNVGDNPQQKQLFDFKSDSAYFNKIVSDQKKKDLKTKGRDIPSYEQVLNGEKNALGEIYIFQEGDVGDGIKVLKDKLKSKNLADETKSDNTDIYNERLIFDIYNIQNDNNIDVGNRIGYVVDSKTLQVIENKK